MEYKKEFSEFCSDNNLKDYSKKETDLLNYILFTNEAKQFYLTLNKSKIDQVIGLQEGFGLFVE